MKGAAMAGTFGPGERGAPGRREEGGEGRPRQSSRPRFPEDESSSCARMACAMPNLFRARAMLAFRMITA
jgi:hypothetical protein